MAQLLQYRQIKEQLECTVLPVKPAGGLKITIITVPRQPGRMSMEFWKWLKAGKNGKKSVRVVKLQEESIDIGEMAAGHPTGAAAAIKRMMEQKNGPTRILVVGDGRYSTELSDYSLKMAQRLDCEIVALHVSDVPLQFAGERRETERALFYEKAESNIAQFNAQAEAMGVNVEHVTVIGDQEKAIAELSARDPLIRYVLTEPECQGAQGRVQIPVFDLACSRL
jgi:thiamine pyrophosphate-dependent acetolactate synthase large subunit-like protein